ncbi:MAG: hypothetical protein H6659_01645 [Ardenticatenaceae bacterium]|nr:hypothetical protein [Ardenticatenaceae bacterium]MCB8988351.1 hypothetical protein [Ardenticatenaceae bacterium]
MLLVRPVGAQAESGWQASAEYAFGQAMTFHLQGSGETAVTEATLFFQAPEFDNTFVATVPVVPAAAGDGRQLDLTHRVDLGQVRLAPFTTVTYWWVLKTAAGETITLPSQQIRYQDDQFLWQELTQGNVQVHWTGDDLALGQLALDVVAESLPRWQAIAPMPEAVAFDLYLYPSSADLRAALRLTGRDWVGAHAHPELGVLLVTAVNSRTAATDLRQSIPHELTHYLLYQAMGPVAYDSLPIWLGEGLATMMEANPNPNYEAVLETAVSTQQILPFSELCERFPIAEDTAVLAYAQSESLVRYIQARFGNQTLQALLAAYTDGLDCDAGVQRATGVTLAELQKAWLAAQQPQTPLMYFFRQNSVWLLLLAGGFVMAGLIIWQAR